MNSASETAVEEDLEEGEIADEEDEENTVIDKHDIPKDLIEKNSKKLANGSAAQDSVIGDRQRDHRRRSRASHSDEDDRDISRKKRRRESEEVDEFELELLNIRGHSPLLHPDRDRQRRDSGDSDFERKSPKSALRGSRSGRPAASRKGRASPRRDRERDKDREKRRERERERDRDREQRERKSKTAATTKMKEESICAFYMEGKCSRGSDCPYSHAAVPPRKMELCKFYMMECCAKKDKCLYMHKDFPCKFFHTGRKCRYSAEDCKFSHDPLSETTRAILIKHIETAPREILGDFPRMSRDEAIQAVEAHTNSSQPRDKRPHIPSLFEINLGPPPAQQPSETRPEDKKEDEEAQPGQRRALFYQDTIDTEESKSSENSRSIWFGQLRQESHQDPTPETVPAPRDDKKDSEYLSTLPRRQRELFRRVQQQQREPTDLSIDEPHEDDKPNDDQWYSSDEEGERKSLADVLRKLKETSETSSPLPPPTINFSNINVEDIAKALSTINSKTLSSVASDSVGADSTRRDPRVRDPRTRGSTADLDMRIPPQDVDLRVSAKPIATADVDLRASKLPPLGNLDDVGISDIDLRRFSLPFSSTTPAPIFNQTREIDASYDSHPPFEYRVIEVDRDPPDYSSVRITGLMTWASLDPRLQKGIGASRSVTSTDTPSIPLGPASPDPVQENYGRDLDHIPSYHPRPTRDPRKAATFDGGMRTGLLGAAPSPPSDPRGKPGLLGMAPPGVAPHSMDAESSFSPAYRPNLPLYERGFEPGSQSSPRIENRRDPRQRNRIQMAEDTRSYTPPVPADRILR